MCVRAVLIRGARRRSSQRARDGGVASARAMSPLSAVWEIDLMAIFLVMCVCVCICVCVCVDSRNSESTVLCVVQYDSAG
jgi:hypothetical protein